MAQAPERFSVMSYDTDRDRRVGAGLPVRLVIQRRTLIPRVADQRGPVNRITFGDVGTSDRADAERVADRFAPGTLWSVSICERRPDMAVLHHGLAASCGLLSVFSFSM
jgi:hypothetical protein